VENKRPKKKELDEDLPIKLDLTELDECMIELSRSRSFS
jgi:hypothetical protein